MNTSRAFTLFELLVVLAIVSLMIALVPPMLAGLGPGAESRGAARQLAAGLRLARNTAITRQRETRLIVDLEQRHFQVSGQQRKVSLPAQVVIKLYTAQAELLDGTTGSIRFFPDGSATGGHITLGDDARVAYQVNVDWLTGRITVAEPAPS
jgi:general secretion pathway protein H